MKNEPKRIYLQVGADFDFSKMEYMEGITWCSDKINKNDIEFINKKEHQRIVRKLKNKIKNLC